MIRSRANGEQLEVQRSLFNPWKEVERVFVQTYPARHKWFTVLFLRRELDLSWRNIGRKVGYSHVHCKRVFAKAAVDVAASTFIVPPP